MLIFYKRNDLAKANKLNIIMSPVEAGGNSRQTKIILIYYLQILEFFQNRFMVY